MSSKFAVRAALCALPLLIAAGCTSQNERDIAEAATAENQLPAGEVAVKLSRSKADFLNLRFESIPADGQYRIADTVKNFKGTAPLFVTVSVPGGDLAGLLACDNVVSIIRTGDAPVSCSALEPRKNFGWIRLTGFTCADLEAIAPEAAKQPLWFEFAPADGVLDWQTVARFNPNSAWMFTGVKTVVNADADAAVEMELVKLPDAVQPPKHLKAAAVVANRIDLAVLDREKLTRLDFNAAGGDLTGLKEFPHLRTLFIADPQPELDCALFTGMAELRTLRVTGERVSNVEVLSAMPDFHALDLQKSLYTPEELEKFSDLLGCRGRDIADGLISFARWKK